MVKQYTTSGISTKAVYGHHSKVLTIVGSQILHQICALFWVSIS